MKTTKQDPPTAEQLAKAPVWCVPLATLSAAEDGVRTVRLTKDVPMQLKKDFAQHLQLHKHVRIMDGKPDDGALFEELPEAKDLEAMGYDQGAVPGMLKRIKERLAAVEADKQARLAKIKEREDKERLAAEKKKDGPGAAAAAAQAGTADLAQGGVATAAGVVQVAPADSEVVVPLEQQRSEEAQGRAALGEDAEALQQLADKQSATEAALAAMKHPQLVALATAAGVVHPEGKALGQTKKEDLLALVISTSRSNPEAAAKIQQLLS